jgi:hypothetical protein
MENQNHNFTKKIVVWKETDTGAYIPSTNYDSSLAEVEGDSLNDIDWKKVRIAKKNLTKVRLESLKPGEIVYKKDYGYL